MSDTESVATKSLLKLALEKFGELTPAEEIVCKKTEAGEIADVFPNNWVPSQGKEQLKVPECTVRTDFLEWLCTDKDATGKITLRGICISCVYIPGDIDLSCVAIDFSLMIFRSVVDGKIDLSRSYVKELMFAESTFQGIIAKNGKIDNSIILNKVSIKNGELRLDGADVGGDVICDSGKFINNDGIAINADGVTVKGNVCFNGNFQSCGDVRLSGANILGSLMCDSGTFVSNLRYHTISVDRMTVPGDKKDHAISADGMTVSGDVRFCNGFKAIGQVRLVGANVGGDVDCCGGYFFNENGYAIGGDRINVNGSIFLNKGFRSLGAVTFSGAYVCGDVNCAGGSFVDINSNTFNISASHVKGSVYLIDNFMAIGTVSCSSTVIDRHFHYENINGPSGIVLDIASAKIGSLHDDAKSWPKPGNIRLHGLIYENIAAGCNVTIEERLDWLSRQKEFSTQPYEQLAKVYRDSGHEEASRQVLIAKNNMLAKTIPLYNPCRWWYILLRIILGYGYRPWRPFWIGLFVFLVCAGLFYLGDNAHMMLPTKKEMSASTPYVPCSELKVSANYPQFNPVIYSLNAFLPAVNLQQKDYWQPDANAVCPATIMSIDFQLSGAWLNYVFWFEILSGWVLTAFLVAAITGLIRK